jgi:hypothetical protein
LNVVLGARRVARHLEAALAVVEAAVQRGRHRIEQGFADEHDRRRFLQRSARGWWKRRVNAHDDETRTQEAQRKAHGGEAAFRHRRALAPSEVARDAVRDEGEVGRLVHERWWCPRLPQVRHRSGVKKNSEAAARWWS